MNKLFKKYTIGDLLIKYKYENKEEYLNEIKDRLDYCGFEQETRDLLIKNELELIKEDKFPLSNNWVVKEGFSVQYLKDNLSNIPLIELLCIIDEVIVMLMKSINNFPVRILWNFEELEEENENNFLFKEFFDRIEKCYRDCKHLNISFRGRITQKEADNLYENEMNTIVLNRWKGLIKVSSKPYE